MRALPLRVWKARRISVRSPRSSGVSPRRCKRLGGALDDFACLVDEDLAHLLVFFQPGAALHLGLRRGRRAHRLLRGLRLGCGRHGQVGHGLGQIARAFSRCSSSVACCSAFCAATMVSASARWSASSACCDSRLSSCCTVASATSGRAAASASDCAWSTSGGGAPGSQFVEAAEGRQPVRAPAHHRAQVAGLGVEAEQRPRHLRLHAEHVDHEAQRAEVVGQPR